MSVQRCIVLEVTLKGRMAGVMPALAIVLTFIVSGFFNDKQGVAHE